MEDERMSKFKSATLAFAMLVFIVIIGFEGLALGEEDNNVPEPVLVIEKTIVNGDTLVPIKTQLFWELQITVTNNGDVALDNVIVKDTLPAEIELVNITTSKGSTTVKAKKGATKIKWTIGTMASGDVETLNMWIATKKKKGGGRGGGGYHFTKPGEYSLNQGATVNATDPDASGSEMGMGYIMAGPTDNMLVFAQGMGRHRMGMDGGMGGHGGGMG